MGAVASSCKKREPVDVTPHITKEYSMEEVKKILETKLGIDRSKMHLSDLRYGSYPVAELVEMLNGDNTDKFKYINEGFDCDDYAHVMLGREREWYRNANMELGSTFGMVWGDIRTELIPDRVNNHALNFFIDPVGEVWLVEPQTDEVFPPKENSTYWFACL